MTETDPAEVRAADCPRRFVLMADGGVRILYACGAVEEDPDEVAVDLRLLEERPRDHHHRLRFTLPHPRLRPT